MVARVIDYAPKTNIRLAGFLGKKYGKKHSYLLERGDPREAVRALEINHPGFARDLIDAKSNGQRFAVFKNGKNISEGELALGGARDLWFVPIIEGSKRGGTLQTIVGAVLVVAGLVITGGTFGAGAPFGSALITMGASMMVGGVIQMLSPQAKGLSQSGSPENLPSYAFGSAKNTTASGNPVPICIGHRRWGGAIISASIEAQDKS
ncbi:hypothetical protein PS910_02692 [Pseudomonas fluorescens]|nr:hypothetical protein PS910_02692 [Pseudomonas fluorescens]